MAHCLQCGKALTQNSVDEGTYDEGYCDRLCRRAWEKANDPPDLGEGGHFHVSDESWVAGVYDHIASVPIYIKDKEHLRRVCEAHNKTPKAFLKPKSQGSGYEAKW